MSLYQPPQPHTHDLVSAVLRLIHSTHYADESSPHWDAEREYSAEQVALAARDLVRAVDALPEDQRPIGWDKDQTETDATTPDPWHFLHAVIHGARHAVRLTREGRTAEAIEHVNAIDRLTTAYRTAVSREQQTAPTEVTVSCLDVQMDDGENLKALGVGNYLELDRPTAGMAPGTWRLTAYHGEFAEQATLRLLTADEVAALRRAEAFSRMYA